MSLTSLPSDYLQLLAEVKGLSGRNLKSMLVFHRACPNDPALVPQPVAQMGSPAALPEPA